MNITIPTEAISLEYHDDLNPVLFTGDHLNSDVRQHLLNIADAWIQFTHIPEDNIKDIIATGGNFNYNYTKFSDIDVHIIIDKTKFGIDLKFLDDYLQSKKALWLSRHNITVKGYNVELYAQDISEIFTSEGGVYSLRKNEWLEKPTNKHLNFSFDKELEKRADAFEDNINTMIQNNASLEDFYQLKKRLKNMRLNGIRNGGEFSQDNLLFKELRNRKVLDKMNDFVMKKYDQSLSEDVPTNSMGASASNPSSGPIQGYSPLLLNEPLKRRKFSSFLKRKGK